jgi:hypothetical protein
MQGVYIIPSCTGFFGPYIGYHVVGDICSHIAGSPYYNHKLTLQCYTPGQGVALLVNMETFQDGKAQRCGSEQDVKALVNTMNHLNFALFEGQVFLDQTRKELDALLLKFAQSEEAKKAFCLMVIVMSHGNKESIVCHDGSDLQIGKDILEKFTNDVAVNLRGIPKVFIFPACR